MKYLVTITTDDPSSSCEPLVKLVNDFDDVVQIVFDEREYARFKFGDDTIEFDDMPNEFTNGAINYQFVRDDYRLNIIIVQHHD